MYCLYVGFDYTYIDVNALAQGIKSFLASHVCMYVCMCVCMCVCTGLYTYVRVYVCMYSCMYVCVCVYVYSETPGHSINQNSHIYFLYSELDCYKVRLTHKFD